MTTPAGWRVTVGMLSRFGRAPRWCYGVEAPDGITYASPYRYGSPDAARTAGERSAAHDAATKAADAAASGPRPDRAER